jgi:hypothetical protein
MATKKKTTKKKSATKKTTKAAAGKSRKVAVLGKCGGWKAALDIMPPGTPTLRVTGKCVFPTHGYKVKLTKAVPQGINPKILLLRKTVTPPTGPVIQTPQTVKVSFTLKTKTRYTHVTILPEVTTIKVQIVT